VAVTAAAFWLNVPLVAPNDLRSPVTLILPETLSLSAGILVPIPSLLFVSSQKSWGYLVQL